MQIINKLWMVLLAGGFALAGCGAGAEGAGAGDFATGFVDIADCVANPFDAACDSAKYDDAKQYRLAFCSLAENAGHVRCENINTNINTGVALETQDPTPQDTVLSLLPCESTPFSPNCGAIYETARQTRAEFCAFADNATAPQCRGAIVSDPCILDPNRPDCGGDYADNRAERLAFCALLTNAQNPICIPILSRPTYATWLHSFQTPLNTRLNKDSGTRTKAYTEFLQTTADGLDLEDVKNINGYRSDFEEFRVRPETRFLNNGYKLNGFTTVRLNVDSGKQNVKHYAGILAGTDLGAPLRTPDIGEATSAVWPGNISIIGGNIGFNLTVNFTDKSIYSFRSHRGRTIHHVNGIFNERGVIDGKIAVLRGATLTTGDVTGLIGEAGLVAVFKSNERSAVAHTGGFTARPISEMRGFCQKNGNGGRDICKTEVAGDICIYDPFHRECPKSKYEAAQQARIAFCTQIENVELDICIGAINYTCKRAPYVPHCGAQFDDDRAKRFGYCIIEDRATSPICANAIAQFPCIRDPFDTACGASYETARTNREVYCITSNHIEARVCDLAYFSDDCFRNPYKNCDSRFEQARIKRLHYCTVEYYRDVSFCSSFAFDFCTFATNASLAYCVDIITATPCIGNPFADACDDSFATIGASRLVFCLKPANMQTPFCQSTITASCTATPFASHCGAQFDTTRDERTAFCQRDNNAISDTCAGAVKNTLCLRRPFTRTCGRDYDTVRDNLRGFCMQSANTANPLCDDFALTMCIFEDNAKQSFCADAVAAEPCIKMPFELGCGVRYNEAQWYRVFWCAKGANAQDALCANNTCIENPFGASCMHKNYSITRAERITFCTPSANQTHSLCAEVNARVTTARWVNGFDYSLPPAAAMADTWSKFLRGTFDGLDVGDLRDGAGAPPIVHTLNMRNGAGGENLAGSTSSDSSNGVGFFQYTPQGGTTRYYAGLFSGVNLGAPLVNPDVNPDGFIVWHGWLHETGLRTPIPISFNINLSTRRFHAFEVVGHVLYEFTTDFDAQGVITGYLRKSINRNDRYGTVHGLIGEAGAIGAFVGNEIGGRGYAGGFIARPPSE